VHYRRVLPVRHRGGTAGSLPGRHVRRPRLDYESHATGLDRNELGALRVAAGLGTAAERTLVITRKGGKVVTIPLAPRTARAIDLAVGERCEGPIFLTADGRRLDRHGAGRIVRRMARRAGITKPVGPHTLRHAFITAALDAGVPLRDVQEAASHADPRTTMRSGKDIAGPARHLHRRCLSGRSGPIGRPRTGTHIRLAPLGPGGPPPQTRNVTSEDAREPPFGVP
jgi:integrase